MVYGMPDEADEHVTSSQEPAVGQYKVCMVHGAGGAITLFANVVPVSRVLRSHTGIE